MSWGRYFLFRHRLGKVPELCGSTHSSVSYDPVRRHRSPLTEKCQRAFDGTEQFILLSQGEVDFILEERRSQRDQFLVILVVTLLFIVVFNNSTIYGRNNELKCVIVLAVALEAGGHFVTEFLNISHSLSSSRRYFIGSKVAKWHWPNIIWFPWLPFVSWTAWSHTWHTFSSFFSRRRRFFFSSFFRSFILDFRKGKNTN